MLPQSRFGLFLGVVIAAWMWSSTLMAEDYYVCPWWMWGQTGSVCHYYSEFHDGVDGNCPNSIWGNYDGDFSTPLYGNCPNISLPCLGPFSFVPEDRLTELQYVFFQNENAAARKGSRKNHAASSDLKKNGYDPDGTTLFRRDIKPSLKPNATIKNGETIVRITGVNGVIYAKLFHVHLDKPTVPGLPAGATAAEVYYGVQIETQPGNIPNYPGTIVDTRLVTVDAPDENGDTQTFHVYRP